MTNDDVLSDKQRMALPIFCIQLNVEKACAEAGISKQTFYQWMKNPIFKRELKEMRRAIGTQSIEQLKIESKRAADTLTELLNPCNPPAVRRAAANDILNYVLKFRENETLLFELYEDD
ncbi:MAG: hypothetical protein JSR85_08290 [Proteobacteria bacterium]|nr:hypothetical protein [Pseudomonadota bacterium]